MFRKGIVFVIIFLFIGVSITSAVSYKIIRLSKVDKISVNDSPAPDFTLTDIYGINFTLSNYRGKVVLINFMATWCSPCKYQILELINVAENFSDDDLKMISIDIDLNENNQILIDYINSIEEEYNCEIDWTFAIDTEMENVKDKYEFDGIPTTVIVDKKGNISFLGEGIKYSNELILEIEKAATSHDFVELEDPENDVLLFDVGRSIEFVSNKPHIDIIYSSAKIDENILSLQLRVKGQIRDLGEYNMFGIYYQIICKVDDTYYDVLYINKSLTAGEGAYVEDYYVKGSIMNITLLLDKKRESIQDIIPYTMEFTSKHEGCIDEAFYNLPNLSFGNIKPEDAIYLSDKKIISFSKPIIFGDINIEVNFTSGRVLWVQLYVDNEYKCRLSNVNNRFTYLWDEQSFGKHEIRITATDVNNNTISETIDVWKFF